MKLRYSLLVSAFACSQIVFLQAANSQMDPDLVPPEVFVPVPGAPTQSDPSMSGAQSALRPGMPQQPAGRYAGMPAQAQPTQGAAGQFSQFQNPYAAALQQQAVGIQPFVPAGWPFDGLPPPGGLPGGMPAGFPAQSAMQGGMAQAAMPQGMQGYQQGYGQPGLGSTAQQPAYAANSATGMNGVPVASSGNGQVLANDPDVSKNDADPNTQGPFSDDKECLMCKKKKGEGVEGDATSTGSAAGSVGGGMASAANPSINPMLPPPAQVLPSGPAQQMQPPGAGAAAQQQDPIVVIQTTKGPITIRLFKQYAPITCNNFMDLVRRGFYNGIRWHRVVPGFVIQAGCPKGDGTGGFVDPQSGKPRTIPLELHQRLRHNAPGVVAMARFGNDPNSASSQFYITLAPKQQLDNKYSVFGGVVSGMDTVQKITANDRILGMSLQGN